MTEPGVARSIVPLPVTPGDGLVIRRYRGPEDHLGMAAANQAARDAAGVEAVLSVAQLDNQYANLPHTDIALDIVVVEVRGEIIGYSRLGWSEMTDGSREYDQTCIVRPDWLGRGIGRVMLGWGEARRCETAAAHMVGAETPAGPLVLGAWTWDGEPRATRLLARAGYAVAERGYDMVRPHLDGIPDLPVPGGLELRPARREDRRAAWEAAVDAFRDHPGEMEDTEADWRAFDGNPLQVEATWIVAWDGGEIAGAVFNVIDPAQIAHHGEARGYLDAVFVRRPWRRRGLARALVARSLTLLRDRGMTSAFLGVSAANPNQAMTLYESLGFAVTNGGSHWRKPLPLVPDR